MIDRRDNQSIVTAPSIPCKECLKCTGVAETCPFALQYGDGSPEYALRVVGRLAKLNLKTARDEPNVRPVTIHLATNATGHYPTRVDGILGLAFQSLDCNPTCVEPAWHALGKAFELQLGDQGGQISFFSEQVATRAPAEPALKLAVIGTPKCYYATTFPSIALNNLIIFHRPQTLAVMDSGSTLMILTAPQFDAVQNEMQRNFCHLPGICGLEVCLLSYILQVTFFHCLKLNCVKKRIFSNLGAVWSDFILNTHR